MKCPNCGRHRGVIRTGRGAARLLREFLGSRKYHCARCSFRWLTWPPLSGGRGAIGRAFRGLRELLGGRRSWSPSGL